MKWVLVRWNNGKRVIVHKRSVVTDDGQNPKPGDVVKVHWAGYMRVAVVVALASERESLESMMKPKSKKPKAGPSRMEEEDEEDFSPSASSWAPSDDDTESADTDEEVLSTKKQKIIAMRRQFYNSIKEVQRTPKRRSSPGVPQSTLPNTYVRRRSIVKSHDDRINKNRLNRSLPNFAKKDRTERNNNQEIIWEKLSNDMKMMKKNVIWLAEVMEKHRKSWFLAMDSPNASQLEELSEAPQWHESPESPESLEAPNSQANNSRNNSRHRNMNGFLDNCQAGPSRAIVPMEEDNQISEEEFDRSDDDILITNKFNKMPNKEMIKIKTGKKATAKSVDKNVQRINDKIIKIPFGQVQPTNENLEEEMAQAQAGEDLIGIGTGQTLVQKDKFNAVNWKSYTVATRSLLLAIFPRKVLATHSLTGKKSPAFQNKPAKKCLDPVIINDVIYEVIKKFGVTENLVRSTITTKCADEAKMYKMRKAKFGDDVDVENIPPQPNSNKGA